MFWLALQAFYNFFSLKEGYYGIIIFDINVHFIYINFFCIEFWATPVGLVKEGDLVQEIQLINHLIFIFKFLNLIPEIYMFFHQFLITIKPYLSLIQGCLHFIKYFLDSIRVFYSPHHIFYFHHIFFEYHFDAYLYHQITS